ncbi:MAG: topoisomerase II [Cypionkella sp.]
MTEKAKKRDPRKTARNRRIAEIKEELKNLWPQVSKDTGYENQQSFNAVIGGKAATFIDLKNEVIKSQDEYFSLYLRGFTRAMNEDGWTAGGTSFSAETLKDNYKTLRCSTATKRYFTLFLKRSYLNHYDELVKSRPKIEDSEIWIGQNNAEYGLLVAPRYQNGIWENDKSEIRHFPKLYWTIGHVLETGLVVDGDPDPMSFTSVRNYLDFFKKSLVRASGSQYERAIAQSYCDFVLSHSDPEDVPLLIPEYRYLGKVKLHKYRLDFCIVDPITLNKVGFELSPWSSHGAIKGVKNKSQKEVNQVALANFEKETTKLRDYFRKHRIYTLIYTDTQLKDINGVFDEIKDYLDLKSGDGQLEFDLMEEFL